MVSTIDSITPIEIIRKSVSDQKKDLYRFFEENLFWERHNDIKLEPSIWRGQPSEWSLRFSNDKSIEEIFRIDNPAFCGKYTEATRGGGQESQKIHTLHSSSLAALLLLQHVSKEYPISIPINGHRMSFTDCYFEHKNLVSNENSRNYSYVDIMLVDREKKNILFLESKFSEYLKRGSMDFSYTDYYMEMYDSISETLKSLGINHRRHMKKGKDGKEKEIIRLEIIDKHKPIYCEGIKQMISHYMGVKTECMNGSFKDTNVYLGEILFDFRGRVPNADIYLRSYADAYEPLRKVLQKKAENMFGMTEMMTWQTLLSDKSNIRYLDTLEPDIKAFYRL